MVRRDKRRIVPDGQGRFARRLDGIGLQADVTVPMQIIGKSDHDFGHSNRVYQQAGA
jgi:hypothetical protein